MDKGKGDAIQLITSGQPAYPARLKEIKDYPRQLYCLGDPGILSRRCVAVIGSRTTTAYGRNTARAIAGKLAGKGVTVISGLAAGIDACAHEGALEAGGPTAAVLGCGVDVCYPPQNRGLKQLIENRGLIVSEYPPGEEARSWYFPMRNRIISGLSEMTVVVQARDRSGALITAELAAEQGREVMAVPGNIDSQYHLGANKLIQEGVTPVIRVDDVLEALGLGRMSEEDISRRFSPREQTIYRLLQEKGEMRLDDICLELDEAPQYLNPILSAMEIKGAVCSTMGKFFLANM